jgi:hypothetical protein
MRAVALLMLVAGCGKSTGNQGGFRLAFVLDPNLDISTAADFKAVLAKTDGFAQATSLTVDGIELRTEDVDGKAGLEMVLDWPATGISQNLAVRIDFANPSAFTTMLTATAYDKSAARLAVGTATFDVPAGSVGEHTTQVTCLETGCTAEPPTCVADGTCDPSCAAGTDPDCPVTVTGGVVVPGFNAAAGTVTSADYKLRATVTYTDFGTTTQGGNQTLGGGVRH